MSYNIPPKKTWYNDELFDSRLEARWACVFDHLSMDWDRGIKEFSDRGYWIPDFILKNQSIDNTPIHVEVKPWLVIDEFAEAIRRVDNSGCKERVLLLGGDYKFDEIVQHSFNDRTISMKTIGYMRNANSNIWESTALICSDGYKFRNKSELEGVLNFFVSRTLESIWKKAGRIVQYDHGRESA